MKHNHGGGRSPLGVTFCKPVARVRASRSKNTNGRIGQRAMGLGRELSPDAGKIRGRNNPEKKEAKRGYFVSIIGKNDRPEKKKEAKKKNFFRTHWGTGLPGVVGIVPVPIGQDRTSSGLLYPLDQEARVSYIGGHETPRRGSEMKTMTNSRLKGSKKSSKIPSTPWV